MATMNISLNDALRDFVQERVETSGFSNASDYVRSLIRADKERAAEARLEALLLAGLASGEAQPVDAAFWQKLQARAGL
jgi:antitoxin ParD1/3/4